MRKSSTCTALLFAVALSSRAQQLYSNGAIATGSASQSGTAAPAGTQWSEVQNDAGNPAVSNAYAGFGSNGLVVSEAADDFVIPVGQTWTITTFRFMGYQPGAAGAFSPFSTLTLRVWRGQPGAYRSRIFFGDSTTNRLTGAADAFTYRIPNSLNPMGSAVPASTARKIWEVEAAVAPGLVLPAGTYWVSWSATATGTQAYYFVPVTTVGARTQAGANAQLHSRGPFGTYPWSPILDPGTGLNSTPVNIEMAFRIFGSNVLLATQAAQTGAAGLLLQASPVPAADVVQITLAHLQGRAQLLLSDFSGRLVWTGPVPAGATTATVPLAAIASGSYLLEARTATGSAHVRIVKQ
ncbi:T9SS type A sorting domain-containing protein [Hymenobacter daeguensis]